MLALVLFTGLSAGQQQEIVFRAAGSAVPKPVEFQKPGTIARGAAPANIVQVQAKGPKDDRPREGERRPLSDDLLEYQIRLDPPSIETWSRLDSEKMLEERMRQEAIQRTGQDNVKFPERVALEKTPYQPRQFPVQVAVTEPRHVPHSRLLFEDKNAERYGWDLGFVQPLVSTAYFYKDVLFLPHNLAKYPFRRYETSAGHQLPGDPVPYMWYPPELTLTGGLAEAGTIIGLSVLFP